MSTETLNNWTGWLQARIPSLKESHNVYWLKQAMEGYKKDGVNKEKEIQTEDIVDIINDNYREYKGVNEGMLHAAEDIIELFKSKQIEPDFQKVLHESVFENMRDKPLKNRVSELDKDKMTENLENMLGNLSSPSLMPDLILKKYEDSNEFHFHKLDRKWIIECMNEYKDACVDQREKEMINEFADILNGIRDNVLIINNLNHGK